MARMTVVGELRHSRRRRVVFWVKIVRAALFTLVWLGSVHVVGKLYAAVECGRIHIGRWFS